MKRVDLYSILINEGYKLPKQWKSTMEARADIASFINDNIKMTAELQEKMALYTDKQWDKLVWRLNDNGHSK